MKESNSRITIPLLIDPKPSATLRANSIRIERQNAGKIIYNCGLGANPLPAPEIVKKALSTHASEKDYGSPSGLIALATLIAKRDRLENYTIEPENVLIAPGLKQLLQDVQMAFGGPIVHIVPHWVSYKEQAKY